MKALVTGSRGFVGGYLRAELLEAGYEVTGTGRTGGEGILALPPDSGEAIERLLREREPDVIFHLAGQADVARSWREPAATFDANVTNTARLLEAVRKSGLRPRVLLVGSSDEYGALGDRGDGVTEDMPLLPRSPYGVSKKAQEELGHLYADAYGMDICMTRSFNHAGAGQRAGFLISDFAEGIARVEAGESSALRVGNLESYRDYTHVRDVARAYRYIAEKGRTGEVYNVGSGKVYSAREILERFCALAGREIPVEVDPGKLRPSDTPIVRCCRDKLTADTGWEPRYTINDILTDALEYQRKIIRTR